jgi:hypothetical protein
VFGIAAWLDQHVQVFGSQLRPSGIRRRRPTRSCVQVSATRLVWASVHAYEEDGS